MDNKHDNPHITAKAKLFDSMTFAEYLKSDAFKERLRKAREEWQKKHPVK